MKKKLKLPVGLRAAKIGMEKADPNLEFRVGAALLYRGHILVAWNKSRTAPSAKKWYKYYEDGQSHAEWNLFSHGLLEQVPIRGTVYIYRELADGSLALARPCSSCISFLKSVGIKTIVYTIYDGWVKEKL